MAGYFLGADLYLEILWVPTWANPGDAPSREVGLSVWRKKAEIAADISLGSLLAQDRYAEDAQRSHELGAEWATCPQPELMTGCSLNPSSVHPRRQVVRRHVAQRARRECWDFFVVTVAWQQLFVIMVWQATASTEIAASSASKQLHLPKPNFMQ